MPARSSRSSRIRWCSASIFNHGSSPVRTRSIAAGYPARQSSAKVAQSSATPMVFAEHLQFADDAAAPVDDRSEDVEGQSEWAIHGTSTTFP